MQKETSSDKRSSLLSWRVLEDEKKVLVQVNAGSGFMTFPQIWVESVCDDSSDDDNDEACTDDKHRRRRQINDATKSTRCMSYSSTDVSFESASTTSLSPASTRQVKSFNLVLYLRMT